MPAAVVNEKWDVVFVKLCHMQGLCPWVFSGEHHKLFDDSISLSQKMG